VKVGTRKKGRQRRKVEIVGGGGKKGEGEREKEWKGGRVK
jgi:hypothetical protein